MACQLLGVLPIEAGVGVEPVVRIALVLGENDVVGVDVAEAERGSALALDDAVQLPATGEEVEATRHAGSEAAAFAEWGSQMPLTTKGCVRSIEEKAR